MISIMASVSSSSASIFAIFFPQIKQSWTTCLPFLPLSIISTGYIRPLQLLFLSPGNSLSTCLEKRQYRQWFLQVFSALGFSFPQFPQMKLSLIFVGMLIDLLGLLGYNYTII